LIQAKTNKTFHIASVPEFLKEGTAVEDTLHPDRVVIGVDSVFAKDLLIKLHTPLTNHILVMNPESAQMTKYAANNYLATRITFINQIADLCEYNGADIEEVIKGIGADRRIGPHYWYPGLGYGGSCFPKDVKEIAAYAKKVGENNSLFITINDLNESRINRKLKQFKAEIGTFATRTVSVLGLSFKKNTNDTRVAPSLAVIPWLISEGAIVRATDPQAIEEAKTHLSDQVFYAKDAYEAATGSDIVMLLVEWDDYTNLDLAKLKSVMNENPIFIDTRNQYKPDDVITAGFKYIGIGR
jgi:UDPglucose 6-dehydrogenase